MPFCAEFLLDLAQISQKLSLKFSKICEIPMKIQRRLNFYGIIAKISQICALIRYHEAYAEFVDIALVVD